MPFQPATRPKGQGTKAEEVAKKIKNNVVRTRMGTKEGKKGKPACEKMIVWKKCGKKSRKAVFWLRKGG